MKIHCGSIYNCVFLVLLPSIATSSSRLLSAKEKLWLELLNLSSDAVSRYSKGQICWKNSFKKYPHSSIFRFVNNFSYFSLK